jgi:rRNA maturation protein Nop10
MSRNCPFCGSMPGVDGNLLYGCPHANCPASMIRTSKETWNRRYDEDDQCPICGDDHEGQVPLVCETGDGV